MQRVPNSLLMTPSVDTLVAGPVSKNTNAAPGETPAIIKPAATGVDLIASLRREHPALHRGVYRSLDAPEGDHDRPEELVLRSECSGERRG